MHHRQVTKTGKARDHDILALCGSWGRTDKWTAIREIEQRLVRYYVMDHLGHTADVLVVGTGNARHLRTSPDPSLQNNLEFLPDC